LLETFPRSASLRFARLRHSVSLGHPPWFLGDSRVSSRPASSVSNPPGDARFPKRDASLPKRCEPRLRYFYDIERKAGAVRRARYRRGRRLPLRSRRSPFALLLSGPLRD
jgi:hypothetical protein